MNEAKAKAEIAALSDRMVELAKNQSMDIYVSALIHTLRSCADAVSPESAQEIGRVMLRVGGLLVSGIKLTSSSAVSAASAPTSSSIH